MKWVLALFLFIATTPVFPMPGGKFSEAAWRKIEPIYQKILLHRFNKELGEGTLSNKRFTYYSDQDAIYLGVFARALTILMARLEKPSDRAEVSLLLVDCSRELAELEEKYGPVKREMAYATQSYADYLLATAAHKSTQELAAALLPCYLIYLRLAQDLKPKLRPKHPYREWITIYSSASYSASVEKMSALVDRLASDATPDQKHRMFQAFERASRLERYFFDGAYKMEGRQPPPALIKP